MNIFKAEKLDTETSEKLGGRLLKIFIVAFVCFLGSLVVTQFVSDRIDYAQSAFKKIDKELPTLLVKTSILKQVIVNKDKDEQISKEVSNVDKILVKSPEIDINTKSGNKTLGKQKFVSFSADVNVRETITLPELKDKSDLYLQIPLFANHNVKDFKAKILLDNTEVVLKFDFQNKGYGIMSNNDQSYYEALIPKYLSGKTIQVDYSWKEVGSRKIAFNTGEYIVNLTTDWQTVRLNRSDYGKLTKTTNQTVAIFNFDDSYQIDSEKDYSSSSSDSNSGNENLASLQFMSGTDDITLTDRVTRYAALVILLTFFVIFILDMKRRFSASILQYILVGASLCLFYLLNLSLSEYIGFTLAYSIATLVTMIMNGWYVSNVLNSRKYGMIVGFCLLIIYLVIYWLMSIESINLLAGTIILYILLMLLMVYTSKINQSKL